MMRKQNETQKCRLCELELSTNKFHIDKSRPNGFNVICKTCRNSYRRLIYMSDDKYKKTLASQNNKCAICRTDAQEFKKGLNVDHDYKTNKIRGLLCTNCNMGLGHFKDTIDNLIQAIAYLVKHGN